MQPRSVIHWGFFPLLLPLLFAVAQLFGAPSPGGPIPGIDDMPRAPGSAKTPPIAKDNLTDGGKSEKKEEPKKGEPTKEEPKKGEPTKEEPKKEEEKKEEPKEGLPIVRNLRVEPHPKLKYSTVLKWEVDPGNKAPLYVGRYQEPIVTRDHVLDAANLTNPALGPQVTTFVDRKMPTGKYYYVVVAAAEMKPGASLILKAGQNTTSEPIIIDVKPEDVVSKKETELEPPAVHDIKAEKHPDKRGAVVVSWTTLGTPSDTVVLRHRRPISDEESFRAAKRVAVLRPWARHFVDREVPRGAYYYAAYLQREVTRDLVLKANENYTTTAFVSDYVPPKKEPLPSETAADFSVSGLIAVNGQASVKLSWRSARAPKVLYNIYRSDFPLDSARAIKKAKLLGETDDQTNFEDAEAVKDRRVYYGVTVTDNRSGKEYLELREGVNFRAHVFQPVNVTKELGPMLPDALTTFRKDARTVMLFWAEPDVQVQGFRIYRYDRPIDNEKRVQEAKLIGRAEGSANRFTDSDPPVGRHYYAVLPLDERGREIREFVERRTFTGFGVEVEAPEEPKKEEPKKEEPKKEESKKEEPKKEEPKKEEPKKVKPSRMLVLLATVDSTDVVLTWEAEVAEEQKPRIRLYRSNSPMRRLDEVREHGVFIQESLDPKGVFRDRQLEPGRYYYAALIEEDGVLSEELIQDRNFLGRPVEIAAPGKKEEVERPVKKQEPRTDKQEDLSERELLSALERVLRETYHRRRFAAALAELPRFALTRTYPGSVRAMALFYTGMSYYRMGQYRVALEYFLNFRVQDAYPRRAGFYYRRSLERLR